MPKIMFDINEIEVMGEAVINSSGNIYIENGRKYKGKKVSWVISKKQGSNKRYS